MIDSIEQLILFLQKAVPNFQAKNDIEFSSTSPYEDHWAGTDGFIWHFHVYGQYNFARVQARRLHSEGIWEHMVRPLEEVWPLLPFQTDVPAVDWKTINAQVASGAFKQTHAVMTNITPNRSVLEWHQAVQRDYWHGLGFSDGLINHFYLGYGHARGTERPARHIIPIPLASDPSSWTMVTRAAEKDDIPHWRPPHSPTTWWYSSYRAVQTTTLFIAEGAKSFLAALEMGFSPALTTNHGATRWMHSWTYDVLYRYPSVDHIVFLGDADDIGVAHNIKLLKAFRKQCDLLSREMRFSSLVWDADAPKGYDNADILQTLGPEHGAAWINDRIRETPLEFYIPSATHNKYLETVREFVPTTPVYPLETLRDPEKDASIAGGIHYFLKHYKRRKGTVYVNASDPGTGKNFALIAVVQHRARLHLLEVERKQRQRLEVADDMEAELPENEQERIAALAKIKKLRRPVSKRLAVVASPFTDSFADMQESHDNFDPSLWYYFQSRGETNCANFAEADRAARLGYNVSFTVCAHCPFADQCRVEGYLAQFPEMENHPIISIRHQHLPIEDIAKAKEIYIDEWAGDSLMLRTIHFKPADIFLPRGWQEWVESVKILPIERFVSFLTLLTQKGSFNGKSLTALSGRDLFDFAEALATQTFRISLEDLLDSVDMEAFTHATLTQIGKEQERVDDDWREARHYQYLTGIPQEVPKRGLEVVLQVMRDELGHYLNDLAAWNSRLTLVGNDLQTRPMQGLFYPQSRPVVVLDATPVKALYEKMFPGREILVFQPKTRNLETKTTVLYGNGFGVTEMCRDLAGFKGKKGDDETKYGGHPNRYLQVAFDCITKLATTHPSLLVITHKKAAAYLKKCFKDREHIAFGNYGAVRGLNHYKDYESVILIGIHQKPSAVFETEMQAWYYDDPTPLATEQRVQYNIPYHDRTDGWQAYAYKDPRLQQAHFANIQNELIQAAARVRPHTSATPKHVYLLGSFPALSWVTDTVYYPEFIYGKSTTDLTQKRIEVATEFVTRFAHERGCYPTQREFLVALQSAGVGMGAAPSRKLLNELKEKIICSNQDVNK